MKRIGNNTKLEKMKFSLLIFVDAKHSHQNMELPILVWTDMMSGFLSGLCHLVSRVKFADVFIGDSIDSLSFMRTLQKNNVGM